MVNDTVLVGAMVEAEGVAEFVDGGLHRAVEEGVGGFLGLAPGPVARARGRGMRL